MPGWNRHRRLRLGDAATETRMQAFLDRRMTVVRPEPRPRAVHSRRRNSLRHLTLAPRRRDLARDLVIETLENRVVNNIIWLVGAVVIVLAILAFFGLR